MRYIPNMDEDRREMLKAIGVSGFDELVADVPQELRLKGPLAIPKAASELELLREMEKLAGRDADTGGYACFLGGGAYDHFIPSVVGQLASRAEFVTSYTPYQAEVSQGTLQPVFEYQSMVCELTGMGAANASMYDGASATAEAALMAQRVTGRREVALSHSLHPNYRKTVKTYMRGIKSPVFEVPYLAREGTTDLEALRQDMNGNTAAVIIQYPNFFGCIEDLKEAAAIAHEKGAMLVAVVDPIALGILKSPGELGADIVVAEGQPLGKPLSFGGPYLGIFACREEFLRQMPGRVVGETKDANGRRGYVLTLQTREQHIRRERATSNICTNESLVALTAAVYMAAMGRQGIRNAAELCLQKSHYAMDELVAKGVEPVFTAPFFKEFAVKPPKGFRQVERKLIKKLILGGLDLGEWYPGLAGRMLIAVTEKRTREEIDRLAGCF
jgi:glycine dehydrogenase subunit 1